MKTDFWSRFRSLLGLNRKKPSEKDLSYNSIDLILYRLEQYMREKKPFLQPGYTIRNLSNDLKIPAYQLSAVINQRMSMNYNDFLNQYRIKYCEELIRKEGTEKINLQELASRCGFHNRNTFATAFKKFTGRTPSDYTKYFL